LAFSRDEVASLLGASLGAQAKGFADAVHEATEGWPAAVRLAVAALRAAGSRGDAAVLEGLKRPGGPLFAYLAEEVLEREPPSVRSFLRRVALFDRLTLELCETLGVKAADKTLASLLHRGLFIEPQGDPGGWFRVHALVRDFAIREWPLPQRDRHALLRQAAGWFERQGHLEEAVRCLAAAPDPRGLARLLSTNGGCAAGRA
jgi:ATP/maltotriose-dependent transcriptional regulator MalT